MHLGHLCQVRGQLAHLDSRIVIPEHVKHLLTVKGSFVIIGTARVGQILFPVLFLGLHDGRLPVDSVRTQTLDLVEVGDWSPIRETLPVEGAVVVTILLVGSCHLGIVHSFRSELITHVCRREVTSVRLGASWRRSYLLKSFHLN